MLGWRALGVAALLGLAWSQSQGSRGSRRPRIDRFCLPPRATVKPPFGDYNFCDAYKLLPSLVRNKAIASAFIDFYWKVITGSDDPTALLTLRRAKFWDARVGPYHDNVLVKKRTANLGRRPHFAKIFRRVDANKDSQISKEETLRHLKTRPLPWVVMVGFAYLDKNKDGLINRGEIAEVYCRVATHLLRTKGQSMGLSTAGCTRDGRVRLDG